MTGWLDFRVGKVFGVKDWGPGGYNSVIFYYRAKRNIVINRLLPFGLPKLMKIYFQTIILIASTPLKLILTKNIQPI